MSESNPEAKPSPAKSERKAPDGFVRGGTPTAKSEALYERRFREAEVRRDEAAVEKALASVPIEKGGAQLLTNQMTRHPEIPKAYILLRYVKSNGDQTGVECLGDLIVGMNPALPTELTLILVCPRCAQGQKHLQDCQIQIRQSNKHFTLVTGKGDPTFKFENKVYKSAGVITESESCTCPDCSWRFRIVNNTVRPDR